MPATPWSAPRSSPPRRHVRVRDAPVRAGDRNLEVEVEVTAAKRAEEEVEEEEKEAEGEAETEAEDVGDDQISHLLFMKKWMTMKMMITKPMMLVQEHQQASLFLKLRKMLILIV